MPLACFEVWIYLGFVFVSTMAARPRFDTSADMGLVLVPADAEVDSVIFRLRATDQDADFPLVFEITATLTPVVRIDNLPCTLYNKVCQANVILTRRLIPGRLHDFAVRVRDTKGDSNSMQATISVTNATTSRDKIFPHIPSLIMVPEDTKPGKELDYLLVRANQWSGKPVYIELWQPKELFTIRQRQTPSQTRGMITLIGELDFETQSMYTLTMYATDPYTEPGKDTRNIAGLNVVVVVQDVQDVPPIFTLAPPLTRINNSIQPGDVILRVHAEDGDKGVPREITYGLVSESNPFTPFFNISETTGEIILVKPLEELTQITHVGAPVVLTVVAEEIRRSTEEPPAQATVVEVGLLLGEPGNSPPYFESDNFVATIDENLEPGSVLNFAEQYSTRVRDEDIGKAGVFALKLQNNNGTFEINPTVAERTADFIITVRDNTLIDYELHKTLSFKVIAQEVGPATNLSAFAPVTIFIRDVNDNPPVFDEESYEVTLSENVTAGTRVVQVHATDKDTGIFGSIQYTRITGEGNEAFTLDPDTGLITVAMGTSLDRETAARLQLSVEACDENGRGNRGVVPLIVNLLDVNDNAPIFEKDSYTFTLNSDLTNFTAPAIIKALDADSEPPNNEVRYELIHGNYENKFYLNEITGELFLRSPITKVRRKKQSIRNNLINTKLGKISPEDLLETKLKPGINASIIKFFEDPKTEPKNESANSSKKRTKRANDDALFTLTARAYDLGVPHLSSLTQVKILRGSGTEARIVMFVVPGEHPDPRKTEQTLATITGGRVTVQEIRPYLPQNQTTGSNVSPDGKRSIVVALVEQNDPSTSLVDIEKIRQALAANGVGIIGGTDTITDMTTNVHGTKPPVDGSNGGQTHVNQTITNIQSEEVTVYKAENKLLFWLLIILGLLMLLAIAALIICCICPGCPFYMAPRKRRIHSSETLVMRSDGRPKRHLHRKEAGIPNGNWIERKQAWSADPTRRNWQFNRRNIKNYGQASLPGDVAYISGPQNDVQVNIESLRLRDGPVYDHTRRSRIDDQERMYMEDIEAQKLGEYADRIEADSLRRHDVARGSNIHRQDYRYVEPEANEEMTVREQHFYREGNAEVLRLVTRGQVEDTVPVLQHQQPPTLIIDGKEILLRRFIEDQKERQDASLQDLEAVRSMESHQRPKEFIQQQQQGIILIPERLDVPHRQQIEETGPNIQRLVVEHGDYDDSVKGSIKGSQGCQIHRRHDVAVGGEVSTTDRPTVSKEQQSVNVQAYSFRDMELARQNALLTRILLEREPRAMAGVMMDTASYLETQSLPGQVAIATQTDRTTATQTDRHVRSRSDNDESEDEAKQRKRLKSKKRHEGDSRRVRTFWMKSPIAEEVSPCFDKRLSILRKKVKEVKEGRKISLEPEVLREISDSLDGNGSSYRGDEEGMRTYQRCLEQTSIKYKVLDEEDDSSGETCKPKFRKSPEQTTDEKKMETIESTSSAELKQQDTTSASKEHYKSPRKEPKPRTTQKKFEVVKPSFRILEREISMLTRKLSKLGEKKHHESTTSDSTFHDKHIKKDSGRPDEHKASRKTEDSSSRSSKPDELKDRKDIFTKTRQKFKYQQPQVFSNGSSEYEDSFEKPKKHVAQDPKQKQATTSRSHAKIKRQAHVEKKEHKKTNQLDQDSDKQKETTVKDDSKIESKSEKTGKTIARAQKLAAIGRRDHIEDLSTSTSSDRAENKSEITVRSNNKKTSTSSDISTRSNQRKSRKPRDIAEKEIKKEQAGHQETHTKEEKKITGKEEEDETKKKKKDAEYQSTQVIHKKEEKVEERKTDENKLKRDAVSEPLIIKSVIERPEISEPMKEHETSLKDVKEFLIFEGLEKIKHEPTSDDTKKIENGKEKSITPDSQDIKNGKSVQSSSIIDTSKESKEDEKEIGQGKTESMIGLEEDIKTIKENGSKQEEEKSEKEKSKLIESADFSEPKEEDKCDRIRVVADVTRKDEIGPPDNADGHPQSVITDGIRSLTDNSKISSMKSPEQILSPTADILDKTISSSIKSLDKKSDKILDQSISEISSIKENLDKEISESISHGETISESSKNIEKMLTSPEESLSSSIKNPDQVSPLSIKSSAEQISPVVEIPVEVPRSMTVESSTNENLGNALSPTVKSPEVSDQSFSQSITSPDVTSTDKSADKRPDKGTITPVKSPTQIMDQPDKKSDEIPLQEAETSPEQSSPDSTIKSPIQDQSLLVTKEHLKESLSSIKTINQTITLSKESPDKSIFPATKSSEQSSEISDKGLQRVISPTSTSHAIPEQDKISSSSPPLEKHKTDTKDMKEFSDKSTEDTTELQIEKIPQPTFTEDKNLHDIKISEETKKETRASTEDQIPQTSEEMEKPSHEEKSDKVEKSEKLGRQEGKQDPHKIPETTKDEQSETAQKASSQELKISAEPEIASRHGEPEQPTEVSPPLFTSIIDTLDDSESDSSSDVSRQTALNPSPYQTPRHQLRKSPRPKEIPGDHEEAESTDAEEENLTIELEEGKDYEGVCEPKHISVPIYPSKETNTKVSDELEPCTSSFTVIRPASRQEFEAAQTAPKTVQADTEKTRLSFKAPGSKNKKQKLDAARKSPAKTGKIKSQLAATSTAAAQDKVTLKPDLQKTTIKTLKPHQPMTSSKKGKEDPGQQTGEEKIVRRPRRRSPRPKIGQEKTDHLKQDRQKRKEEEHEKSTEKNGKSKELNTQKFGEGEKSKAEQTKQSKKKDEDQRTGTIPKQQTEKEGKPSTLGKPGGEIDISKAQPKYMEWYTQKREEMERKRQEAKLTEDEDQLPRWLRKSLKSQKNQKKKDQKTPEMTPRTRRKVKPLVNVESEQLKAIVRQGRKLRKVEGGYEDPPIEIFASTPPTRPSQDTRHPLLQHSEYKFEKMPEPFYLHPPPAPHPSPENYPEETAIVECKPQGEGYENIHQVSLQGGRLRHQQLLEKKSVFDIAYDDAAPSQLRSDSATPPS